MNEYFVDLHIHIGRTFTGKPVKITAAKTLTLTNILQTAKFPKGLNIVGVIDCHSPEVIAEMEQLCEEGRLIEMEEGGFRFENEVTLIPGTEMEVLDENCNGPIHLLAYFPGFKQLKEFSRWLSMRVTNLQLSTQRVYEKAVNIQEKVKSLEGLFIPAHVFTPFKSLYGKGVKQSLKEVLDPELIDGVELGLSSNTVMADRIGELHGFTFVSNSDAHSLPKMAREYQKMTLEAPTFSAVKKALHGMDGNSIDENYGLNPFLGKYYRTACAKCFTLKQGDTCPNCGSKKFTKGVSERIAELADERTTPPKRPPYIHQVPLDFLPGLGAKTKEKLYSHFGSEMNILHRVSEGELKKVVKGGLADLIVKARSGELQLEEGGGGRYGKVAK
ncbi:endonuclease Q family protein [Siminovitchia fortis]|uniref:TIGR00375 family protein n=1 Tax=Siminovitchia fortis TaxID=254758 RepID=A0A443J3Z0_9BACI|nr:endonuclease Q family protein [Siminovitchia fortis]RWR15033.1 TIGR00375 family protein [Siminovitchia fortis]WHY82829.1 endonuclease Q family protein [Siminovitchia fortis]